MIFRDGMRLTAEALNEMSQNIINTAISTNRNIILNGNVFTRRFGRWVSNPSSIEIAMDFGDLVIRRSDNDQVQFSMTGAGIVRIYQTFQRCHIELVQAGISSHRTIGTANSANFDLILTTTAWGMARINTPN